MTEPTVTAVADREAAAQRTAEVMATAIDAARVVHGVAHVALSGGSNVGRVYELLSAAVDDWNAVHLWYGDERMVPHDSPESNHHLATSSLEAPGAIWHPVPTQLAPADAATVYGRELGDTVIDLALNGMGPDGHTASLFPGHPALNAEGIAVAVLDAPKPPPERVTLTLGTFNVARRIVLLATGAEKAPMLARALGTPDDDVPASRLARDRLEVIADQAALGG